MTRSLIPALRGALVLYALIALVVALWPGGRDPDELAQNAANVGLFVPIGFLLAITVPMRRWWFGAVFGMALAVLISVLQQATVPTVPPSAYDTALYTLGALIGSMITVVVRAAGSHAFEQPTPTLAEPELLEDSMEIAGTLPR